MNRLLACAGWLLAAFALFFAPVANAQVPDASASVSAASAPPPPPAPSAKPVASPPKQAGTTPEPPPAEAVVRARATPRRAVATFMRACDQRDYVRGADSLDLRAIARERRVKEGAELAEMLCRVLAWQVVVDLDAIPDEPTLDSQRVALESVEIEGEPTEIALAPVKLGNEQVWLFSKDTVAVTRSLYDANRRRWLEENVPPVLKRGEFWGLAPWQWIGSIVLLGLAYLVGHVLGVLAISLIVRVLAKAAPWSRSLVRASSAPARLALYALVLGALTPYLVLPKKVALLAGHVEHTLYIVAVAWTLIVCLRVGTTTYAASLPEDTLRELANRSLKTRLNMMRRIGTVLIGIVAAGIMLLQFDVVRSVGVSLLASAGIAGVLVGFAAQRTLGGIISGIEISITQPVRMGDVVNFEGHEGVVERIYFTYVVVRLWDDSRLIVPVQQVMSKSFLNLTLTGADLQVWVEIYVDYDIPLDALRAEFERLCKEAPEWDGRRSSMLVIEATDKALKVRGIATIDNATKALALRCSLREGWVRYLQTLESGKYLPKGRVVSINA